MMDFFSSRRCESQLPVTTFRERRKLMNHPLYSFRKFALFLLSGVVLLTISPAHAYYFGNWSTDGYFKSQIGMFTEKKPFNKAEFGGSDDNLSTATQMLRWNLNGQLTDNLALRAEVMGSWQPDYPNEKGVVLTKGPVTANYYNFFDWRELTLEYKPSYTHSIKFGRQILNWGEAVSGRVIDQINPDDSRSAAGFLNLDERYMPLWMFRGQHDFYQYNSSFEWVVAPIWQADRFEHSRGVTGDTPVGDGKTTNPRDLTQTSAFLNDPSARFAAKRDNRIERAFGATISLNMLGYPGSVLGAPYSTGYHGSDILGVPGPIRPLSAAEAAAISVVTDTFINRHPDGKFVYLSESPNFLPGIYDYTDHNFKNTRWGFKTKSMIGDGEFGAAFFQAPSHTPVLRIADYTPGSRVSGTIWYQYIYPRYDTYGIYGNYQFLGTKFLIESAYQPDRMYSKDLMGIGFGTTAAGTVDPGVLAQRLNSLKEIDRIVTLLGVSREQNIPLLNKQTPFSLNLQYTNYWNLQDTEDTVTIASFFSENQQVSHSFLASMSTSYSYNKYLPNLTLLWYPEGAVFTSIGLTYIPEGFNSRLSLSASYGNYWTANEFSSPISVYDNHDSATIGFKYSFY